MRASSCLLALAAFIASTTVSARPPFAAIRIAPRPVVRCPTPTLANCTSTFWKRTSCGKLEMARSRTLESSTCNQLLQARGRQLATTIPERLVVAPTVAGVGGAARLASPIDGVECDATSGRACALRPDYSLRKHFAVGMTGMVGHAIERSAMMPVTNTSTAAGTFRFQEAIRRALWEQNGDAVSSCREMVFEKYYDYSLFEDEITRFANDPRAVVDVAYGPADFLRSIGTRGAAGALLRQRDGTPFQASVAFPTNQLKNVFFATPPDPGEPGDAVNASGLLQNLTVDVPCLGRDLVSIGGIRMQDPTLRALLDVDPRHDESFSFHRDMNEALAERGVLDEELEVFAEIRGRHAALLAERQRIVDAFFEYLRGIYEKGRDKQFITPIDLENFEDPFVNPDPTLSFDDIDADTFTEFMSFLLGAEAIGAELPTAQTFSNINVGPVPGLPDVEAVAKDPASMLAATAAFGQQLCVDAALGAAESFPQIIMILLADLDNRIEDTLQEARDLGCLDVNDPTNPCDWSPSFFSQRVVDLYVAEREQDFERCLEYTGNNFTRLTDREFVIPDPPDTVCPRQDFTTSPTDVERYYACHDEWVRRVLAVVGEQLGHPVLDPRTGNVDIGMRRSGAGTFGNDLLSITFDWESRWAVDGWKQAALAGNDMSRLQPQAVGHVVATGSMFGQESELINAQLKVTRDVVDVDLVLDVGGLDVVVYGLDPERILHPEEVGTVADSQSRTVNFIHAEKTVYVLGIPITLRGSVDGTVGVDYTALAALRQAPDAQDLVLTLTPFVRIDASASASVDLAIVEAGVKGSVILIDLRNPIGAGMHVFTPPGGQDELFKVESTSALSSTTLAGRIAVFAEVDLGFFSKSAEATVVRWGGITDNHSLYDLHFTVPTLPLYIVSVTPVHP